MSSKQSLIVALALVLSPSLGCKEKSNTTHETQPPTAPGTEAPPGAVGSGTNPNAPNPAPGAEPMGSAAAAPGAANNPMVGDAGIDASGSAAAGSGSAAK